MFPEPTDSGDEVGRAAVSQRRALETVHAARSRAEAEVAAAVRWARERAEAAVDEDAATAARRVLAAALLISAEMKLLSDDFDDGEGARAEQEAHLDAIRAHLDEAFRLSPSFAPVLVRLLAFLDQVPPQTADEFAQMRDMMERMATSSHAMSFVFVSRLQGAETSRLPKSVALRAQVRHALHAALHTSRCAHRTAALHRRTI